MDNELIGVKEKLKAHETFDDNLINELLISKQHDVHHLFMVAKSQSQWMSAKWSYGDNFNVSSGPQDQEGTQ